MKGYLDSSLDADAFDEDGWFKTGDLGRIDADGMVTITGRVKDIIIRNMENISAKEVEDVLFAHPDVADVAVIGVPDPKTGERVCAVVVPKDPDAPITFEAMVACCRDAGAHDAEAARAPRDRRRAAPQPHRQGPQVRAPRPLRRLRKEPSPQWHSSTARSPSSPARVHGIGRAHALELAKHGARVVVNDLGTSVTGDGADQKAADLTVELITQRGGTAVANYDDVSDYEGAGRLVAQAVDTYGRLDVLVNNAGIVRDTAIWNMSEADFDSVIKVHLKGSWAPSHHAAKHWRERAKAGETFTGRVINTTSGAGLVGNFGQTNYATAKAGIAGFTQTLSLELYKLGVTVNAVGPAAATRITGTMPGAPAVIEADEVPDDEFNRMDPAVSSPLVAWLASDESQHITGQVIRAVAEDIVWMEGWSEGNTISNGGKRWDAEKLGQQLATDLFKTRAPGLRY